MPSGRDVCYGVSVTASDIPMFTNSCSPSSGIIAGFVKDGDPIELEVPVGNNRKIELFVYLKPVRDSGPCPRISAPLPSSLLYSIYRIGVVNSVNLVNATEVIPIEIEFPGITQHVVKQYNLPVACALGTAPSEANSSGFYVSTSQQTSSAIGYKLEARVGQPLPAIEATDGANYLLKGSVR
ncbi:MAG: hypothetical protein K2Q26_00740 [Bdellovibrionales bacterium]|nr:hypothetical protein [Bdellovibrionales bacterium]